MQIALLAARVYIYSVAGFVAQLLPPPSDWRKYELKAVALLFPGPRAWIAPGALYDPSRLGLGGGLEDLKILSLVARYRVAVYENRNEGGIQVATRIATLQNS